MNIFTEQINARAQNDTEMFGGAFVTLASVLDRELLREDGVSALDSALARALGSIGLTAPKVPDEITGADERVEYVLRATGASQRRVELKSGWWRSAGGSMLGSTVDGDIIAIVETGMAGYHYIGSSGQAVKINKKTAKNINTDAFYFYRPFPAKKMALRDLALFMFKCVTPRDIAFILAASALVVAVGMLMPFFTKQIFDTVIPAGVKENILPMTALLVGVATGGAMFFLTRGVLLARFKDRLSLTVQSATISRLFSLPAGFFKDYSAGELGRRAMSINIFMETMSSTVLTIGLTAVFSFAFIFQMMHYTPSLALPGALTSLAVLAFMVLIGVKRYGISRRVMKIGAKLSGIQFMLFSGVQKIKLAGAEKRAFSKWADMYSESAALEYTPPMILRLGDVIAVTVSLLGSLAIYYVAGATHVSPADYMAFFVAFSSVNNAVLALGAIVMMAATVGPALEMVKPILEAVPEKSDARKIVNSLSGGIEINGLTFRYIKDGKPVLDDFSLKIRSGEYVAIVGKTGCGKSTLLRLLLGFEEPESGAIYYDGQDLKSLDLTSVRQCIGVCLQNGQMFAGDIFSNIIITAPHKTLDDAWAAAEMAGLDKDIKNMPMGMHTMIAEGGGGVSGGQKQRMLIARALVKKPKIMFFDEATSALDNITQKHISDNISSLKCTRIVIAHRLSTIKQATRIIVLDGGKIVEDGSYDALMEKQGVFYELAKRQII
ncbi:MAG: NHLP bacteriocin export ABC transporter permease/ATPase subunit [Chitinispirillia bacterium]|nr:NHLP bacteriocin export ABC transporter permease/ATPase subunit [Chitinispirillia bacterium]MCL2267718.1 NHLP bacteriocin export ABC transporter permease/ATPase subunit [Chitinispirillia bacterium]